MPVTTPRTNRTTGKPVPQPGDMTALRKQSQEDDRDLNQAEAARLRTGSGETPVGTSAAHRPFVSETEAKPTRNPAVAIEALAKAKSMLKGDRHGS